MTNEITEEFDVTLEGGVLSIASQTCGNMLLNRDEALKLLDVLNEWLPKMPVKP